MENTEFRIQRNPEYVETLKGIAHYLMEANEDLDLALIGGLTAQEFYSSRRVRVTSDIDIASMDERIVERLRENNYSVYYNENLKKYSARNFNPPVHIDIYPRSLGVYSWDELFWERRVKLDNWDVYLASPEDMLAIKLYAWLISDRGKGKHLIDFYTITIGPMEVQTNYFANRIKKLSKELGKNYHGLVESIPVEDEGVLNQFSSKERRFIKNEMKRLKESLLEGSTNHTYY